MLLYPDIFCIFAIALGVLQGAPHLVHLVRVITRNIACLDRNLCYRPRRFLSCYSESVSYTHLTLPTNREV